MPAGGDPAGMDALDPAMMSLRTRCGASRAASKTGQVR